jgi:hypothetical protein
MTGGAVQEVVVKYLHHMEFIVHHCSKWLGHDPTIRLLEFKGEASKDPEKNLFICENIWEEKKITDEDTKLAQLAITLRDRKLYWYMNIAVNSPPGTTRMIADVKKLLINEFQKPSSEDKHMNEMIEIRRNQVSLFGILIRGLKILKVS